MKFLIQFLCFFVLFVLAACNVPFADNDPVVVSVGSSKLHLSDIKRANPDWDSWDDQNRLKFLQRWIDEETIYQEAIESGIDKDTLLSAQIEQTVRKMIVDHFLQTFVDTMIVGDGEKIDFYHSHIGEFVRGRTMVSGGILYFKDWESANTYYKGHKKTVFDSVPAPHYLVKKIERFDSLTTTPDSCLISNIDSVSVGMISTIKFCGGAIKIAVVSSRLDSADVLPFEAVEDDVSTKAWLEHRNKVMNRLKKEWKMERPIFSQTDVFSEKEK